MIRYAPFLELADHLRRRSLNQVGGETLGLQRDALQFGVAAYMLHALFDPAKNIPAHVKQHADFLVAAVEQGSLQVFGGLLAARQQALQHQAGPRAFHQFIGTAGIGKGMKNQRWKLAGCLCVEHCFGKPSMPDQRRSVSSTLASIVWDPRITLTSTSSPGLCACRA